MVREKPDSPSHPLIAALRKVEQPCAERDGLTKTLKVKVAELVE